MLLGAWRTLVAEPEHADLELHFVGDGPVRRRLARACADDRRVVFHGPVPYGSELARLHAAADVFVNPSPNEAFGLAALEAAACGVPVVAAARGGPRDVVTPAVGLLAEPGNAAAFADRIRTVLAEPDRFRDARAWVEREYSWQRCFAALLDLYARMLAERSPEPGTVALHAR